MNMNIINENIERIQSALKDDNDNESEEVDDFENHPIFERFTSIMRKLKRKFEQEEEIDTDRIVLAFKIMENESFTSKEIHDLLKYIV